MIFGSFIHFKVSKSTATSASGITHHVLIHFKDNNVLIL